MIALHTLTPGEVHTLSTKEIVLASQQWSRLTIKHLDWVKPLTDVGFFAMRDPVKKPWLLLNHLVTKPVNLINEDIINKFPAFVFVREMENKCYHGTLIMVPEPSWYVLRIARDQVLEEIRS